MVFLPLPAHVVCGRKRRALEEARIPYRSLPLAFERTQSRAHDISRVKNTGYLADIVRRHINWDHQQPDLKEDLVHLVQDIKRRICGIASAGSPSF